MGVLNVYLDKITNLRDEDGIGKSDPYVKFVLEKDKMLFDKGFGKQTSTKKKNDLSPVYGETFTFGGVPNLNDMILYINVMDDDVGKDDFIGRVKIQLDKIDLKEGQPFKAETELDSREDKGFLSNKAKIFLEISWKD